MAKYIATCTTSTTFTIDTDPEKDEAFALYLADNDIQLESVDEDVVIDYVTTGLDDGTFEMDFDPDVEVKLQPEK